MHSLKTCFFCQKDLGFAHLLSKVQTAHFKIRTDKLMLHEDFYISLMELPEEYDFGMYSRLLNTFGTHYITEGTMGGTLEYVLVLNKTSMANSSTVEYIYIYIHILYHISNASQVIHCDVSLIISPTDLEASQAGQCFGASIGISYEGFGFSGGGKKCGKGGGLDQGKTSHFHKPYQKSS